MLNTAQYVLNDGKRICDAEISPLQIGRNNKLVTQIRNTLRPSIQSPHLSVMLENSHKRNQVMNLHWLYFWAVPDEHGDGGISWRSFKAAALAAIALESPSARRETMNCMLEYAKLLWLLPSVLYLYWEEADYSSSLHSS